MENSLSTEWQILIWIISFILASLVVWDITRNNKKGLDAAKTDKNNNLVIFDYKIQASFIDLSKAIVIHSIKAFYLIIVPMSLIAFMVGEIWPTSFFWFVVTYFGFFIFGLCSILFIVFLSVFFSIYPRTVLYHEFSGFFRRQGEYWWFAIDKPFIVINDYGITGRFTLPWERIYEVYVLDEQTISIKYNKKPRWLATLLRADNIVLIIKDTAQVRQLLDFWHRFQTK